MIDILTPEGKKTGKACLKSVAHRKGLYHATVHVWFYTKDSKVLLQKRSARKKTYPNRWDVSVAGHVHAGETVEDAALREVAEEIGLKIEKEALQKIAVRKGERSHPNGIQDNEFYHVFLVEFNENIQTLRIQEEEVDDIRLFDSCILKGTDNNILLVPNTAEYYEFLLSKIP